MTGNDPITGLLDRLAAYREQVTRLDTREAEHHAAVSGQLAELTDLAASIRRTLHDHAAALAELTGTSQAGAEPDGYCPGPTPAWWRLAAADRQEPLTRLRAWVEQVYRPGYGHLAAALGHCWDQHDLCLCGLDILAELWSVLYLQPRRSAGLVSSQAEYQARILPAWPTSCGSRPTAAATRAGPPRPAATPGAGHDRHDAPPGPGLCRPRLAGVPCQVGQKAPATAHGYRDATTDEHQITAWFSSNPHLNLAIATGAPGPDVLDVDNHGPAGNGYAAFAKLSKAGLVDGAAAYVRTPGGGLHAYFTGSDQRSGHLPAHHLDFRSRGGYVLAPPSRVDGKPYQVVRSVEADGGLDWATVTDLLEPRRQIAWPRPRPASGRDLSHLARWLASQQQGNRNAGLFWAANRALEADPAADLSPLAAAARQAGLEDKEITRTLDSARRTGQASHVPPDHQAEPAS
jgi:hypothetical protein